MKAQSAERGASIPSPVLGGVCAQAPMHGVSTVNALGSAITINVFNNACVDERNKSD